MDWGALFLGCYRQSFSQSVGRSNADSALRIRIETVDTRRWTMAWYGVCGACGLWRNPMEKKKIIEGMTIRQMVERGEGVWKAERLTQLT